MHVEKLMTKAVHFCGPDDSLERAAQLMWEHDCGCLPVCAGPGDGSLQTVGMVTDRDICMSALFQHKPLAALRVADAMSKKILACQLGDELGHAEQVMRDARIRRLPVLNEQGALTGMISLADLAREAARERRMDTQDKEITETEVGDTLAAICAAPMQSMAA